MQFKSLKLAGFKSFVDVTEFRIEPGLTGIVGPNGCGKSNLLEAMRWVMGATSAKALRGEGMEDVIFAGSDKRTSRNWAEVSLSIDNAEGRAPPPFTDQLLLDVSRRIDRGGGSTYRINGKEVRARDIQLLFADASTGANSPALVRQGQISELIGARPQNRRRVLEEAGGVSGLHTRRHEAELRLKAAEANLARLDDIFRELDTMMNRLRRESRQAEKYRKLSAEIRAMQHTIAFARWREANGTVAAQQTEIEGLDRELADLTRAEAVARTRALKASEALGPVREEMAIATVLIQGLKIEKERLDLEAVQAEAGISRLRSEAARINTDLARETQLFEDGQAQIRKLRETSARLEAEIDKAPHHEPELLAALKGFEAMRREAELRIEATSAHLAAGRERQKAQERRLSEARERHKRAHDRLERLTAEATALGQFDEDALKGAQAEVRTAEAERDAARQGLETIEKKRQAAQAEEARLRDRFRALEDGLGRLATQARALSQLLDTSSRASTPVLDLLGPERGFELALAAALGEDLNLGLARRHAPSGPGGPDAFWDEEAPGTDIALEALWDGFEGVSALARHVRSPAALIRRLMAVGVVNDAATGDRLQVHLPLGARLVSRDGDLWRWDGLTVRARAPKPAALRLEQRQKLAELEAEHDRLHPECEAARNALNVAQAAIKALDQERQSLARAIPEAESKARSKQSRLDNLITVQARFEAQSQAISETQSRLVSEVTEAAAALKVILDDAVDEADHSEIESTLDQARAVAETELGNILKTRARLDEERRLKTTRGAALKTAHRELETWTRRVEESKAALNRLEAQKTETDASLKAALAAPDLFHERREKHLDQFTLAERRLSAAREAMATAEAEEKEAGLAERLADRKVFQAREVRAGAAARLDSLTQRLDELVAQIFDANGCTPEALGERIRAEAIAVPPDVAGAETLLLGLERERDTLGPVNLRAEEEAREYEARLESISKERLDLTTAIARLRDGIDELNSEGRERLLSAFDTINEHFKSLFVTLFGGGSAELRLIESDDPLEAGLEIFACPPGKRLTSMSLMSGGEQALTATALIFGVFLANPAPVCVLDEVDAPLDDANVDRYCRLLDEMRRRTETRFIAITHNPVTMARMDRLFGVTMFERGVSQLVSVDLKQAEDLVA